MSVKACTQEGKQGSQKSEDFRPISVPLDDLYLSVQMVWTDKMDALVGEVIIFDVVIEKKTT